MRALKYLMNKEQRVIVLAPPRKEADNLIGVRELRDVIMRGFWNVGIGLKHWFEGAAGDRRSCGRRFAIVCAHRAPTFRPAPRPPHCATALVAAATTLS